MLNDTLFNSKMTHKCTIKEKSMDGDGKDTSVTLFSNQPCYFEWQSQVISRDGKELVSINGILFLPPIDIDVNCKSYTFTQTYPEARDMGNNYQILALHDPRDGTLHHFEIWMR